MLDWSALPAQRSLLAILNRRSVLKAAAAGAATLPLGSRAVAALPPTVDDQAAGAWWDGMSAEAHRQRDSHLEPDRMDFWTHYELEMLERTKAST